jgi:hypothetical protein
MSAYDAVDGARSAASKCYRLVASKAERFKEVRLRNDGVLKFWRNWRGHDDVMQTRSIWGSGEPAWVSASLNACLRLGPDPRRALWPAATPAAQTGRTHDRTRPMLQQRQKVLAKAAPSTHDPKRTPTSRRSISAFGIRGRARRSLSRLKRPDARPRRRNRSRYRTALDAREHSRTCVRADSSEKISHRRH